MPEEPIVIEDQREHPVVLYDVEVDDLGLSPFEFRAYMRIVRRAAGGTSNCSESLENMAAACAMSRSKFAAAIKKLIERCLISRTPRDGYTSVYILKDKSEWCPPTETGGGVSTTWTGGCPPRGQGVSTTWTGGVHHVDRGCPPRGHHKNILEEYPRRVSHKNSPGFAVAAPGRERKSASNPKKIKNPSNLNVDAYRREMEFSQLTRRQIALIVDQVGEELDQDWVALLKSRNAHGWPRNDVARALIEFAQLKEGEALAMIHRIEIKKEKKSALLKSEVTWEELLKEETDPGIRKEIYSLIPEEDLTSLEQQFRSKPISEWTNWEKELWNSCSQEE